MSRAWWVRFSFLVAVVLLALGYVYPTWVNLDPATSSFPVKQKMNLGLDLQGGLYLVLGIDFQRVDQEILDRQSAQFKERLQEKKIPFQKMAPLKESMSEDPRMLLEFDPPQRDALYAVIKKEEGALRLTHESKGQFELGLSQDYRKDVRDKTLNQSIEVIRNRIDEFGVAEPSITSQGFDRIVVELPGIKELDRAKELIGRTAKLEFKRVDDQTMTGAQLNDLVHRLEKEQGLSFKEGQKFSEYVRLLNEKARSLIPDQEEIAFERMKGDLSQELGRIPYLLFSKTEVTGDDLQDAMIRQDPETRQPYVLFTLNPQGAKQFEKVTAEHVGKRLAIVLDNLVHSAPVIQQKIAGGQGQITLGRGFSDQLLKEAKDLAIVLRAGALPAQLDFLEQRVVGPSLGKDSIRQGAMASLVGSLIVFLAVAFYYRISGCIAVISLLLNVLFVLALLVMLEATLTLPGIAGIALTVGIAVDSNVLIYERIREELRLGQRAASAIEMGFQKAFRTIVDANVTNAAAGMVLFLYGTGPIKGFAVTLLIGIVTTLFTAIFVCRLMFDLYLKWIQQQSGRTLSI